MNATTKVVLKRDKECKGSVRFATSDDQAIVTNAYISRAWPACATAREVTLTVEEGNTEKQVTIN